MTLKEDSQKFALPEKSLDDVIFDLFKRNELDNFICLILLLSGLGQGVGSKFLKTLVTFVFPPPFISSTNYYQEMLNSLIQIPPNFHLVFVLCCVATSLRPKSSLILKMMMEVVDAEQPLFGSVLQPWCSSW